MSTGNRVVDLISQLNFEGNVIPNSWYEHIKTESGKTDGIGILLLSEIVFWYRWTEVRDEVTGKTIKYKAKFKADKLQKNYQQLSDKLGFSKTQIRDALKRLESNGFVTTELRKIETESGLTLNNVMYIEPVPDMIAAITFSTPIKKFLHTLPRNFSIGMEKKLSTYTESTTKSTNNRSSSQHTFDKNSIPYYLANKLKDYILKNNPKAKLPSDLQGWAMEIDRMMRLDNRTQAEIEMVMKYSQTDSFWMTNILSAAKLRKQFDILYMQSTRPKQRQRQEPEVYSPAHRIYIPDGD